MFEWEILPCKLHNEPQKWHHINYIPLPLIGRHPLSMLGNVQQIHLHMIVFLLGLSLLYSKFTYYSFENFPKKSPIILTTLSYYSQIILINEWHEIKQIQIYAPYVYIKHVCTRKMFKVWQTGDGHSQHTFSMRAPPDMLDETAYCSTLWEIHRGTLSHADEDWQTWDR